MTQPAIRIDGMEQLQKLLQEMPASIQQKVAVAGVRIAGSRLRTLMRRRVPVRSGKLRKAIAMKYGKGRDVAKVTVGLLSRHYYLTLDVGRKPYERSYRKGGPKYKVSGTDQMNTEGLGLHQVWDTHKEEILKILVEGMQTELFKQLGRLSVTGKLRRR
jgi:hypothetical protein